MITIVNENNREAYKKLWEAAMAELNNGATINSLETYFSHIETLVNKTLPHDEKYGRKYSILPIMREDDYFIIDANTRTIKVPDVFRKNGLGVQGDQTAETIYFKINRYFDAMDLNNTEIYIQWENSNGDKGLAKEWVRDIETYDDYMIFGWVLGDLITKVPGLLKFSIRFIKTKTETDNNGEQVKVISYSLNTLTAQAMINSALELPFGEAADNLNSILAGNFQNTTTQTDSEIRVFKFVYEFDNMLQEPINGSLNGNIVSADLIDGQLHFQVSAYVEPGNLTYNLYKQIGEMAEPNGSDKNYKVPMSFEYNLTTDRAVVLDKTYYKKVDNNYVIATLTEMGGENAVINEGTYYEKYGIYTLNAENKINDSGITGYYYATAVGQMPNGTETSPMISTRKVLLSPPQKAVVHTEEIIKGQETNNEIMVSATIPAHNTPVYKWYKKAAGQTEYEFITETQEAKYLPTQEALYKVEIWTNRNLDSIKADKEIIYTVTKKPDAENDILITTGSGDYWVNGTMGVIASYAPASPITDDFGLSYQWCKVTVDSEGNETGRVDIEGATSNKYIPTSEGTYYCKLIATYNGISDTYTTGPFTVRAE